MTDFRIVGIEIKDIGWSWGVLGDDEDGPGAVNVKTETVDVKQEEVPAAESARTEPGSDSPVKKEASEAPSKPKVEESKTEEPAGNVLSESELNKAASLDPVDSSETVETVEEKRGAKRKAKTPEGGEFPIVGVRIFGSCAEMALGQKMRGSASKKRSGDYILTHGKPNESATSSRDSNQNRFRIYFESPPELDRVPKALRRNPNKRWREGRER